MNVRVEPQTDCQVPACTWRIRITKTGLTRYMSHLDFVRTVERAVRRAGLPIVLSSGFNPRPRLSFAPTLYCLPPVSITAYIILFLLSLCLAETQAHASWCMFLLARLVRRSDKCPHEGVYHTQISCVKHVRRLQLPFLPEPAWPLRRF
jgi:hypothetical protein